MNTTTRFCAACGTANEIDASFCDQCGEPLRKRGAAQAPAPVANPLPNAQPNPMPSAAGAALRLPGRGLMAAIGALVLVVAAAVGWVLLADGLPSTQERDRLAADWLDRNRDALLGQACLTNFPYSRSPVSVNLFDAATREWLDALVAAGVYESQGTASGSAVYAHGAGAARHIKGGRLCLADGVELREVTVKPREGGEGRVADLSVGYAWTGVPAFATGGRVGQELGGRLTPQTESLLLALQDGDWLAVGAPGALAMSGQAPAAQTPSGAERGSGFSFGSWLSGLFSFGSGPAQTAEAFYRAVEQRKVKEAVALVHPAQRGPGTEEKIQLLITMNPMGSTGGAAPGQTLKAVVVSETDTSAVVRMEADRPEGRVPTDQRMQLLKHEGRWYVSLQ